MYSDLFDQLGGGGGGGASARRGGDTAASGRSSGPQAPPPLVSCKAGKMVLQELVDSGEEKKYQCVPDTKRGEIRLVYKDSALQWQWYDRREQAVADTTVLPASAGAAGTFERVPLSGKKHERDRVYVWTRTVENQEQTHEMYWMQDASEEKEDEVVAKINQYLADPASAAPPASERGSGGTASGGTTGSGTAGGSGSGAGANQVDALSTILENLGMPQNNAAQGGSGSEGGGDAATGGTSPQAGTLTLADLQGAMAGMQQQQAANQPVPLSEVVTPAAITTLLEDMDDTTKERLMQLLPESQRTPEQLEENLRSPQVQQTLRSLTQALLPDDTGNMDGFYSVLANFQLEAPQDPTVALTQPIQAFLDALLASVKKEQDGDGDKEESKPKEDADGDTEMKDSSGDKDKDNNEDEGKQEG